MPEKAILPQEKLKEHFMGRTYLPRRVQGPQGVVHHGLTDPQLDCKHLEKGLARHYRENLVEAERSAPNLTKAPIKALAL